MILDSLSKHKDAGILLIRLGLGFVFIFLHGMNKLLGGPAFWERAGGAMANLGINFAPTFWGFMSMFAEFFCPMLLILGFYYRPATFILTFNMVVAMMSHFAKLDPWSRIAHSLELVFIFTGLFIIGAGKYSLDEYFRKKKEAKSAVNEI